MAKMKKDESFLGKLGGTLGRKKKAKEGMLVRYRYGVTMKLIMNEADHFFLCCVCYSSWCYNNILYQNGQASKRKEKCMWL